MQRPTTSIAAKALGAFRDNPNTGIIPRNTITPLITGTRASTVNRIFFSNKKVNIRIDSVAIPDKKTISEEIDREITLERAFRDTKNVPG